MSSANIANYLPWYDRNGRFAALRLIVFILAILPAGWMALKWNMGWLSPKPVTDMLRESGDWAMRFIVLVLAITPLRNVARWNRVIAVRRMIGLFAAFYLLVHFSFYFIDQNFVLWRIAVEIILRLYLTIGFVALALFFALAATSNDAMVKRLGSGRWNKLHGWIYIAALLSILHFFMQVRLKAYEPSLIAGLLIMLAGYRLLRKYSGGLAFIPLVIIAVFGAMATALIEAGYYTYSMNAPFRVVLESNLDFSALEYSWEIRPAWYALLAGIAFALIPVVKMAGERIISFRPFSQSKTEMARHR